jgi:hypothetical protein
MSYISPSIFLRFSAKVDSLGTLIVTFCDFAHIPQLRNFEVLH